MWVRCAQCGSLIEVSDREYARRYDKFRRKAKEKRHREIRELEHRLDEIEKRLPEVRRLEREAYERYFSVWEKQWSGLSGWDEKCREAEEYYEALRQELDQMETDYRFCKDALKTLPILEDSEFVEEPKWFCSNKCKGGWR